MSGRAPGAAVARQAGMASAAMVQFNFAEMALGHHVNSPDSTAFAPAQPCLDSAAHLLATADSGSVPPHPGGALVLALHGGAQPRIGRYRIEKKLGQGAMGAVYLGRAIAGGPPVAIKTIVLPQDATPSDAHAIRARFFHEAETVRRLRHPAIIRILEAGEAPGMIYIAMEYMAGGDLTPHTRPGALLPVRHVLSIAAQVADALSCVHARGVVHRDIKPANILRGPDGSVRLTDFGVACLAAAQAGEAAGTPCYMSPEQAGGRQVDARSDLFALGTTLYQLASGRLPFEGSSRAQVLWRIVNAPHAPISGCAPALARVIDRALAKRPQDRFQSAAQMALALGSGVLPAAQ